jgi:hypothetical protein
MESEEHTSTKTQLGKQLSLRTLRIATLILPFQLTEGGFLVRVY